MYIVNVDEFPQESIYKCNGVIGNWLMYTKNIPLLGKSKDGSWCFSNTELLREVLSDIPFYLNITKIFS